MTSPRLHTLSAAIPKELDLVTVLTAMPDPALVCASDGRIVAVNDLSAELLGYPPEELLGMGIENLVPGNAREAHARYRSAYEKDPQRRPMGHRAGLVAQRLDGTEIPVDISLSPVAEGFTLAAVRDVSALVQAEKCVEEELRMAADEREALRLVAIAIAAESPPGDLFALVAAETSDLIQAPVFVARFTAEGGVVAGVSGYGSFVVPAGTPFPLDGESAAAEVFRTGRTCQVRYEGTGPITSRLVREGMTGGAGAPIRVATRLWGALTVGLRDGAGPNILHRLERFAELLGHAIGHAEARQQARDHALGALRALAHAVDAKDTATHAHSERMARLSARLAMGLGWEPRQVAALHEAALLHDVGKIGIPDHLLLKPGRLTGEEYEQVKGHVSTGVEIVRSLLSDEQLSWVAAHHERYDGLGYPRGIQGPDIPEGACIMAVADAWDVMTSDRPYAAARSSEEALAECVRGAGTHFAPGVVDALVATWESPIAEDRALLGRAPES
jgi:PAS domain S-box-containing protein/putative nucleotidyltransferase with HDIG domain